jgi:hypothetical protein
MRSSLATRLVWIALLCSCTHDRDPSSPAQRSAPAVAQHAAEPPIDAGNWARNVVSIEAAHAALQKPLDARAAVMSDDAEDSDELTPSVRLVYRVSFSVPASFRDRRAPVSAPAGELQLDVSSARLRARFIGPGWPVADGSEVRLRADLPGVYLFDGLGGRSLGAGQLATWFEGHTAAKGQTLVAVRRDYGPPAATPLDVGLLCAFLAEWSDQPREGVLPRCAHESPPPGFRIGPWTAELTAVVPMEVQRRALRADGIAPPARSVSRSSFGWIEASAVPRLLPAREDASEEHGALVIDNQTDTRAIVLSQGVPVGWIDAGASLQLDGLRAGMYRVGAIRPLGVLRMAPKLIHVPGRLVMSPASAQP